MYYPHSNIFGKEIGWRVRGSGFGVHPWSVPPFDSVRKRGSGFCRFNGFSGEGAAHKNMEAPRRFETSGVLVSQPNP